MLHKNTQSMMRFRLKLRFQIVVYVNVTHEII
jgi:hypothetical protein